MAERPWSDNHVNTRYARDNEVAILTNMVQLLRAASSEALSLLNTNQSLQHQPYAQIAYPSFFFNVAPRCDAKRVARPAWQRLAMCNNSSTSFVPYGFAQKMSRAVYGGGFKRTASLDPVEIAWHHDSLFDVMPSSTLATCTAGIGQCWPYYGSNAELIEPDPCTNVSNIAMVLDLTTHSLTLNVEGVNECFLDSAPWNSRRDLQSPRTRDPDKLDSWASGVWRAVRDMQEDIQGKTDDPSSARVVLAGPAWDAHLLYALQRSLAATSLRPSSLSLSRGGYAASMGAAAWGLITDYHFYWAHDDAPAALEYGEHDEL